MLPEKKDIMDIILREIADKLMFSRVGILDHGWAGHRATRGTVTRNCSISIQIDKTIHSRKNWTISILSYAIDGGTSLPMLMLP